MNYKKSVSRFAQLIFLFAQLKFRYAQLKLRYAQLISWSAKNILEKFVCFKIFRYICKYKKITKYKQTNLIFMKHTEVPNEIDSKRMEHKLEHGDKIIYASVRRYMNRDTRECYPSQAKIAKDLGCSRNRVDASILRLQECGLIEKRSSGRKNHYYFPKSEFDKKFEMFTDDFLDMDLDLNVKEFYMDIQQFLYGKDTGIGKCSMPNTALSKATGWTIPTIKKYKTVLIEKGLLTETESESKGDDGLPIIMQNYNLTGLNQAALWVKQITEEVVNTRKDVDKHSEEIDDLKEQIRELQKFKDDVLRKEALERNKTYNVSFSLE